jgi:hypothetical protein
LVSTNTGPVPCTSISKKECANDSESCEFGEAMTGERIIRGEVAELVAVQAAFGID